MLGKGHDQPCYLVPVVDSMLFVNCTHCYVFIEFFRFGFLKFQFSKLDSCFWVAAVS